MRSFRACAALAFLLGTSAPSTAQDPEPDGERMATRIAVMPAEGNCHASFRQELSSVAMATVSSLDQDTFETVTPERLLAEQMGLGEPPCATEKCWLELTGKLGIPFLLRTECITVGGTAYATTRFFNAKNRALKASQSLQAEAIGEVRAKAPELYRATVEEALGVTARGSGRRSTTPNPLLQRKVAVIVCERPEGARAWAPDRGTTGAAAQSVVEWLRRTDHQVLDAPSGFDPGGAAGCELEGARSARLASAASATVVAWLRASDVRVDMPDRTSIHTEFSVTIEGRAYNTAYGRHGPRFEARAKGTCKQPVLKAKDCKESVLRDVVAEAMQRWEESLALPPDKF